MELELRQLDDLDPDSELGRRWEALAAGNPAAGVMQSLHWAAFKRRQGLNATHFGLFEDGALIGGALCYAATQSGGLGLLVAPEGPVLPWEDEARTRAGLRLLLDAAQRLPDALALRVEPRLEGLRPRALRAFRRAPLDLLPPETLYLDLRRPPEAILAGMRPKGRYNIRLAARHGVTVRADRSAGAVRRFAAVLEEAGERDAFFVEPPSFFDSLADALAPPGIARFLFAEHNGATLGALLLTVYGDRTTYLYGGVTNRQRHLMAGYALQWAAIETAQAAGCAIYDFYGYEPYGAPDHVYAGFSRFKRQFGGRPVRLIGAHDAFFLDRLADAVVRAASESAWS
ncbi:MAG TPA: peptidoglycan bridge formation glycyltransferase FemA/FemB family protein [Roseiflexaceae bacterium]|nr:peptidoglycan bridge formation glycyltransferase FemA/FemB family protein [Roseiflexaceae bacterium]